MPPVNDADAYCAAKVLPHDPVTPEEDTLTVPKYGQQPRVSK